MLNEVKHLSTSSGCILMLHFVQHFYKSSHSANWASFMLFEPLMRM